MSSTKSEFKPPPKWKILYRSAISGDNVKANLTKISEAEQAILTRLRELSHVSGTEVDVEREALDDSLYALRALRNCVKLNTAA